MKILSIDVGIKNLAFCLFEKHVDSSYFNIAKWDIINLSQEDEIQTCKCTETVSYTHLTLPTNREV